MEQAIDYKVPGGKLIRIRAVVDDKIRSISIHGDFFIHPEERVSHLEKALLGSRLEAEELSTRISKGLGDAKLVGVNQKAFLDTLIKLKKK